MIWGNTTLFLSESKNNISSPLEKVDHPELENREILDGEEIVR